MAKIATTVYLADEAGAEQKFGPSDDLPDWAVTKLAEAWPADRDDLWAEAPKAKAAAAKKADDK